MGCEQPKAQRAVGPAKDLEAIYADQLDIEKLN
jgi:hypothetical protein